MAVNIDDWKPLRDKSEQISLAAKYLLQTVEKTPNGMLCLQFEDDKGDEGVHSVVIVVRQNPEAAQKLNCALEAVENAIIDKKPYVYHGHTGALFADVSQEPKARPVKELNRYEWAGPIPEPEEPGEE